MGTIEDVIAMAGSHGLHVSGEDADVNEAGLDYRVVMATDEQGQRWVLRMPRRTDVSTGMAAEERILDLVRPVLAADGIAVPDWRIRSHELIAYPALPGAPGLTLTAAGEPVWHMDPASEDYAVRLGRLLARLHSLGAAEAAAAGVEVRTAPQVREAWSDDIARVSQGFTVQRGLAESWQRWLDDDACWPDRTVMTHGEIYPAHVLLAEDGAISGVLDWTTACVDDPARDLSAQFGAAGQAMLRVTLAAYEEAGGHVHPGLAAQAEHLWDAAPIGYGLYALTTGADADLAAAQAMLDPEG